MRTLFLNPNASAAVTQMLRERIAAAAPPFEWSLRCLEGAPEVIASAADNARAGQVLREQLPGLAAGFERLVLMSSLDTGHALAGAALPGVRVHGFTRGVLAAQRRRRRRVHVLTFGAALVPEFQALFAAAGGAAVVAGHAVLDVDVPLLLQPGGAALRSELAARCEALHADGGLPVFIVGALALAVADRLRDENRPWIVEPVAELLFALAAESSTDACQPT